MMQISKKDFVKKKGRIGVTVHMESKHVCDCLTRGYRKWLGLKRYGHESITQTF